MKAKIFSLSLLSMMAVPKGEAAEAVDGTFGTVEQTLRSFYEVVKKPSILEDAQVHAALADTLVPDLMRQKMEAESQAATALSFLSLLGFQIGEGSPLPLEQQVQNYIRAKEHQEASLREITQGWDGTKRQLAEATQAEEEKKIALSSLEKKLLEAEETRANQEVAYKKLVEAAQKQEEEGKIALSSLEKKLLEAEEARANQEATYKKRVEAAQKQEEEGKIALSTLEKKLLESEETRTNQEVAYKKLAEAAQKREEEGKITLSTLEKKFLEAEEARATQQAAYIIMEQKLVEAAQEREKTKSQLTRMLQEHIDIKDGTTTSGDEEFGANLAQVIDLTTVPALAKQNQSTFFEYLDSLKDGQNDLMIEGAKTAYTHGALKHIYKMGTALQYLQTAQITANQVTEQLTKVHQAEMEAARMAMKKKLATIIQEQIGTNEVALPGIGGGFAANVANLTVPTLPAHAKENQTNFFAYLESLKDGQNDWLIEGAKEKYNVSPLRHIPKMTQALLYLQTAQITVNQVTERLTKTHQAEMEAAIAMGKKLAEIIQERVSTNEVTLPGIGGEFPANVANLTVPTLPAHAKQHQSTFFEYLDSLKDGQNELLLQETKNAYNTETRTHPYKMLAAITYLKIAAQVTERLTKNSVEGGQGQRDTK